VRKAIKSGGARTSVGKLQLIHLMVNENHPCKYGDVIRPAEDVSHPEKDKTHLEDDVSHPIKDNFHQEDLSHPEVEVSHLAKDFRV
jgi:hypothetical protein